MATQKLIVVTGGAGFVGSNLCRQLVADGHRVISLDNYFTGSRENHLPGVEYREGHTKDIDVHIPESPDRIYHLGEYSRVEKSFEDVEQVWDLNQFGTFAVLEFARRTKAKLIYAGSSTKFADEGLGRDQSPYAWSKASMTDLVKNYGEWFGLEYAITYFYNVYGPGERAGAFGTVVEIFKQQYQQGLPITVVAPGTQERIFTHVDDIVAGLLAVGEQGQGDGYGIGSSECYSILDLAKQFNRDVVMLPERQGNRKVAAIDTSKTERLGWRAKKKLTDYIEDFVQHAKVQEAPEKRILVFTTTFHPVSGPAEDALCVLMERMPEIHFDIITTAHTKEAASVPCHVPNGTIHRVGYGNSFDKFLLPILGARKARELSKEHSYLFSWSLMASYGALAALLTRRAIKTPLLITLADQKLSARVRLFLAFLAREADQVYASLPEQGKGLGSLSSRLVQRRSLGVGDVFGNAMRFAYSSILREHAAKH